MGCAAWVWRKPFNKQLIHFELSYLIIFRAEVEIMEGICEVLQESWSKHILLDTKLMA